MLGIPELTREVGKLTTQVSRLVQSQLELVKVLKRLVGPPNPTGKITFNYKRENGMAIVYEVDLPQLPGDVGDVVKGTLEISYDGKLEVEIDTVVGQLVVENVTIPEGVEVSGRFYFTDDAGNISENPTEVVPFTVVDNIAPPDAVGGLGFRAVGEAETR